jgi:hypothetical protein
MSTFAARGRKHKCRSEACALPFYDLNRTVISCPNCGAPFELETSSIETVERPAAKPSLRNRFRAPLRESGSEFATGQDAREKVEFARSPETETLLEAISDDDASEAESRPPTGDE